MTKAAYSAHFRSSPHLDCNETYLSHPLISHLPRLLSGNVSLLVQSGLTFDRKPNGAGPSGGRLENHSLCDDALDRRGGRRDRRKTEVKCQFSCLKWSMKLYSAGAGPTPPAKVPLLGAHTSYAWSWHQALPFTTHTKTLEPRLRATKTSELFERDMGGTVRQKNIESEAGIHHPSPNSSL